MLYYRLFEMKFNLVYSENCINFMQKYTINIHTSIEIIEYCSLTEKVNENCEQAK